MTLFFTSVSVSETAEMDYSTACLKNHSSS